MLALAADAGVATGSTAYWLVGLGLGAAVTCAGGAVLALGRDRRWLGGGVVVGGVAGLPLGYALLVLVVLTST